VNSFSELVHLVEVVGVFVVLVVVVLVVVVLLIVVLVVVVLVVVVLVVVVMGVVVFVIVEITQSMERSIVRFKFFRNSFFLRISFLSKRDIV
jgi:hypothetical protein